MIVSIILGVVLLAIYLYRNYRRLIITRVTTYLEKTILLYHSLGKIKIAMAAVCVAFISLSVLLIGMIQDFFANEFSQFDTIAAYLTLEIFSRNWTTVMRSAYLLTSWQALVVLGSIVSIWIMVKGKNKKLEILFLSIVMLGGEFLEEILRVIFHRGILLGTPFNGLTAYTFPSEQAFMSFVAYGFAAFIFIRHTKRKRLGTAVILAATLIGVFSGLSPVFFQWQYPSDVAAGYVFGGVWLSINISI